LGDKPKALDALNQALAIRRATKDISGEVSVLQNIALIYNQFGEYQKALDALEAALPLVEGEKNRPEKAEILNNIGLIYYSMGDFQKALDYYNQALSLSKILGDRAGEASTLYGLGGVYNTLGEHQKALASYDQALVLARAMENRDFEAKIFSDRAIVHRELGENQLSLSSYNQALLIYRKLGDRSQEAFVLDSIASVYRDLGENQQALNTYNQALSLERQVGDAAGEADILRSIASVYSRLGNYPLSLDTYNQALSAYRTINNLLGEARTLSDITDVYQSSQEYDKALDFSNQALSLWRKIGDRPGQIQTLTTIAKIYKSKGNPRQTLSTATQIQSLGRDWDNGLFEGAGLIWMGVAYRDMGDYQKSLDLLNQGRLLWQGANGWSKADARALREIGQVYQVSKQPQKAIEFYNQELVLRRKIGDRAEEAATLYSIATVERDRGNLDEAKKQAEAVINIVESLRSNVVSQELRTSYFASVQKYYQFYIDLLMQLHKQQPTKGYDSLALVASEQARARSLLEILNEANADIRQGVDPKLLEQERSLEQQLDAAEKRRIQLLSGKPTAEQAAALDKQVNALLAQYQEVEAKIRATSPRYAALTQPKPLTLAGIQQQVLVDAKAASRGDDDTLLLEYSLGETRSYLWAVTKTGITSYELPKRADIEAAAQSFYEQSGKQKLPDQRGLGVAPRRDNIEVTTQLSQMLLSPVAGQLGSKRLLIVSDGALQYLPFAALPAPDTIGNGNQPVPLIVKHEIINLPSASTLAVLRQEHKGRQPATKTLAVLADPVFSQDDQRVKTLSGANSPSLEKQATRFITPTELNTQALTRAARESGITFNRLPFTRKEAERILALVPAAQEMQALDFAASRALATSSQLSQYQIVHFATHGILNSKNPELSGVVLSLVDEKGTPENGFLRLHDIFNLNLPTELVVLSACETGLGQEVKGEGLIGLTRGFMYAGTPRVLVSLWSVNDEATSELMSRFYKKMLQEKLQPAAALRAAQIEMLQNPQWKQPYYWAAFTLQGEWR
jgi:CHAT domain-containing protein/tetratricopeptide (TPR) repeat protein